MCWRCCQGTRTTNQHTRAHAPPSFRKERDFHRMHHKRVAQEKNRLITDIKRLKACAAARARGAGFGGRGQRGTPAPGLAP